MFKKKDLEMRLSASVLLALRVSNQALRKYFNAQETGWTHADIHSERDPHSDIGEISICINGKFFGEGTQHFYDGSVVVVMAETADGWRSTHVHISCCEPQAGCPFPRSFVAYITDYMAARLRSHSGNADVIPSLCSRYSM